MRQFRLKSLFAATAAVATMLFVGSHLGVSAHWMPRKGAPPALGPSVSFQMSWDGWNIIDLWWHPDEDGEMQFEVYGLGEQPPFA